LDKTSVLLIGSSLNIPDNIAALGFTFSDKVKVLGMDISRNPEDWNQNFSRILGGINKKMNSGTGSTCLYLAGSASPKAF
jgi:hypothetical protein